MAKKAIHPVEQHVEKIILGIAVIFLIVFFIAQIIMPAKPRILPEDVVTARKAVEVVQRRPVPELQLPTIDKSVKEENLSGGFFPPGADIATQYNPMVAWAPLYRFEGGPTATNCVLPQVAGFTSVEPFVRQVTQLFNVKVGKPLVAAIDVRDLTVVDLQGIFDMQQQRKLLEQLELDAKNRLPKNLQAGLIMWVEIQRQVRDPKTGQWEPPDTALVGPGAPSEAPTLMDLNFVPHFWPPSPKLPFVLKVHEGSALKDVTIDEDRLKNLGEKEKLTTDERAYVELIKRVMTERINPLWTHQEQVLKAVPSVYVQISPTAGRLDPVLLIKYVPKPAEAVLPPGPIPPPVVTGVAQWYPVVIYDWPYPQEVVEERVLPIAPTPAGPTSLPDSGGIPPAAGAGVRLAPFQRNNVSAWFHDYQIAVGQTYRYRMRARLFNPLFGQASLTTPANWCKVSLEGPWSQWTTPVTIESRSEYWMTRADHVGLGDKNVTFEIYKPIDLFPRKATAVVKIGERIAVNLDKIEFPNPADRPMPSTPASPKPFGPLQIKRIPADPANPTAEEKKQLAFDTGAYLVDCDPDNRRLESPPPQYLPDPSAVVLTAAGELVELFSDRSRKDAAYKATVAMAKDGLELPPGKAVREATAAGPGPMGPGPGGEPYGPGPTWPGPGGEFGPGPDVGGPWGVRPGEPPIPGGGG